MTLKKRQERITDEINSLGDCLEQFSYLTAVAAELPTAPEMLYQAEHLVSGCQSKVWLKLTFPDGKAHLEADSDTWILKGILYLLYELLEDCPAPEIAETEIMLFSQTELTAAFPESRNHGLKSILTTIQHTAVDYMNHPAVDTAGEK